MGSIPAMGGRPTVGPAAVDDPAADDPATDDAARVRQLLSVSGRPGARTIRRLRGGRDRVFRAGLADGSSVVAKLYDGAGEDWVREASALAVLEGSGVAPDLLAEQAQPPGLLMRDLGTGRDLGFLLLGDDPQRARAGVLGWARATARLHLETAATDGFAIQLAQRCGEVPVALDATADALVDAGPVLDLHARQLGVAWDDQLLGRLSGELRADPDRAALSAGDSCPDNVLRADDGTWTLIDFEDARFRHVAWDLAYLTVPWPTCWCAWLLPPEVCAEAVAEYRRLAAERLPYVSRSTFEADLRLAGALLAMLSVSWFLARALADDPDLNGPERPTPSRRAMICHRLGLVAGSGVDAGLGDAASSLLNALHARWGDVPMTLAPAFRAGR